MIIFNSNKPIKVTHLEVSGNQSMLNGVLVIEMINNSFSESKKNFDENVLIEKNKDMGSEKYTSTRFR